MDEVLDSKLPWMAEELGALMENWEKKGSDPAKKPDHMMAYFKHYKHWAKKQPRRLHAIKIRAYVI